MQHRIGGMRERLGSSSFIPGFGASGLLMLLVFLLLPVRYETNDDMGLISGLLPRGEGLSSGVGFLSHPVKLLLNFLYTAFPGLPWYGIFMYGGLFLAMGLILSVMARGVRKKPGLSLLLPVLLMLFLHLVLLLNFTAPTLLLAFAAALCLAEWSFVGCPVNHRKTYAVLLFLTLMGGVFIRQGLTVTAMALVALPLVALSRPRQIFRALPLVIMACALIAGNIVLKKELRQDLPEQPMGRDYRALRSDFHDTIKGQHHGERTREALAAVGWTHEDYAVFQSWILYDEQQFNSEKLRLFLELNDPGRSLDLTAFLKRAWGSYTRNMGYVHLFLLGLALLLLLSWDGVKNGSREDLVRAGLALILVLGAVAYLLVYRFKPRVYIPLFIYFLGLGSCLVAALSSRAGQEGKGRSVNKPIRRGLCLLLLLLIGWQVTGLLGVHLDLLQRSRMHKGHIFATVREVTARSANDPMLMVMDPALGLGMEYVHPLREWSEVPDVRVLPAASSVNSAGYFQLLNGMGLSGGHDLLRWMMDNENVLCALFAKGPGHSRYIKGLWESYMNRRVATGPGVSFVPEHDFRNSSGWGMVYYLVRSRGR